MCPQCTAEDCHEYGPEDDDMAKITKAQGPSYREGEAGWDGNSSSTSTAPEQTSGPSSEQPGPSPAQTTENPSESPQTDQEGSAGSVGGESPSTLAPAGPSDDGYDDMLKADLQDEAEERGLSVAGNKAELIARLRAADAEE